jgi:hypothetical protein
MSEISQEVLVDLDKRIRRIRQCIGIPHFFFDVRAKEGKHKVKSLREMEPDLLEDIRVMVEDIVDVRLIIRAMKDGKGPYEDLNEFRGFHPREYPYADYRRRHDFLV